MKNIKNKKSLVALVLVAILGIVGVTIAYFTSEDTFTNIFRAKTYQIQTYDIFESPSDWLPGTTTEKQVYVQNSGAVVAAVRISYTESWKDSNNQTLPLNDGNNVPAAIINFVDDYEENWTKVNENGTEYYYYKKALNANDLTTPLMESVTFNPNVDIGTTTNCEEDAGMTTCTTTASGYAGGTYTLTLKVETVQFNQYKTAWGTNVSITAPSAGGSGGGEG